MQPSTLSWQSKLILLLVLPASAGGLVLQARQFWLFQPAVVLWTLGLSALLGLIVIRLRAGTPAAAFTGAVILASLIFSTAIYPYLPWHSALLPVLALCVLTFAATRLGRARKEHLGLAEGRHGRQAAQVAANLGLAALAAQSELLSWLMQSGRFAPTAGPNALLALGLAALAESAADTVSSEVGQALGGMPRLITSFKKVPAGQDGGITLTGTLAGAAAAALVAACGAWALRGGWTLFVPSCAGGLFGLLFDSLLGATLERRGWLNNDAVNFVSTASAALVAALLLAI